MWNGLYSSRNLLYSRSHWKGLYSRSPKTATSKDVVSGSFNISTPGGLYTGSFNITMPKGVSEGKGKENVTEGKGKGKDVTVCDCHVVVSEELKKLKNDIDDVGKRLERQLKRLKDKIEWWW